MYRVFFLLNTFLLLISQAVFCQTDTTKLWQAYYITPRSNGQHLSLENNWQLSHRDQSVSDPTELLTQKEWIIVKEPTTVQTALHKAGKLPNAYEHLNSKQYHWVEEKVWYYRKKFTIPKEAQGNFLFLCFDGLDYYSKVWVNNKILGRHEGMFGGPSVEIKELIKYGEENEVVVELTSAKYDKSSMFGRQHVGKIIKGWALTGGLSHEPFFPFGMWRGARIEIVPQNHLERPYLVTNKVSDKNAVVSLSTEIFTDKHTLAHTLHAWEGGQKLQNTYGDHTAFDKKLQVQVVFKLYGQEKFRKVFTPKLYKGRNWLEEEIMIPNPVLWQPNGLGEPTLYQVTLSLMEDGKKGDEIIFDYGIRTIEQIRSAGPRLGDRWKNWQFIINGKPIFLKGMNWMPADVLLDLPPERYNWLIGMAKAAGIQLMRVWGAGLIEPQAFYDACNRHGIVVWQDFLIANHDTQEWEQDIWEAQVVQNIFRLRNEPSLAVWCGGNEFNPYSYGNAAAMGILERSLEYLDPSRMFLRTSPEGGSVHIYPDFDPTWFKTKLDVVPFVAETGIHSITEPNSLYEIVKREEFQGLADIYQDKKIFADSRPEFIHHFAEYNPYSVGRMLSRASHINDMQHPTLETMSEATQIGAGEYYQIMSEKIQGNYPYTTGLMPWVYKRPWPVVSAIHLVDGFGHPSAPYYFLKRTYESTHVSIDLPRLLWAPGEQMGLSVKVTHTPSEQLPDAKVTVSVLNEAFKCVWKETTMVDIPAGTSVTDVPFEGYTIPKDYQDRYLFLLAELEDASGNLLSRSFYHPRSLAMMEDTAYYEKYVKEPVSWPILEKGPWLKPTVVKTATQLKLTLLSNKRLDNRSTIKAIVQNIGSIPAFMSKLDISGAKRSFYASDNFFWLAPGEIKEITLEVLWREPIKGKKPVIIFSAWNAERKEVQLKQK